MLGSKVMAFAYRDYSSDIPFTFLIAEPSKGHKKANNRLNATTRCEAASF